MTDLTHLLLTNFAISAALFALLWLASIAIKDPSFIDAWWAFGVVVLSWSTYLQLNAPGPHAYALLVIGTLWGLRLGAYLTWRWRKHGADRRYAKMAANAKEKSGLDFPMFALLQVFAPQLVLQFVMALPVMLGPIAPAVFFGAVAKIGLALALFGIVYEGIADAQLAHFKSDPRNAKKIMDRGLWHYSRHPNYFGELCTWWGAYLVALETGLGAWSLPGPLLITFLLTRVSGAPTTEPHLKRTRPQYEAYKARTSAFFPLPPKAS